jgi:DNA-binding transcriptional regulator YiaG
MAEPEVDFENFVDAIRELDLDKEDTRATSHTSAVTVREWEQVQGKLAGQPGKG